MKYSKLPRLFVEQELHQGKKLELSANDYKYIVKVHRVPISGFVRVFNNLGQEYIAQRIKEKIQSKFNDKLILKEVFRENTDIYQNKKNIITVFAPKIKSQKFELMCDMITQLGADEIIPLVCSRTQKYNIKYERINKIITESARQSERITLPKLYDEVNLYNIDSNKYNILYFANENQANENLVNEIKQSNSNSPRNDRIGLIIGPEGGFTDEEIIFLQQNIRALSISLGENVLRSELAAVVMLCKIKANILG